MKKLIIVLLICTIRLSYIHAQFEIPGDTTIYTQNQNQALSADGITNPIREGAYKIINAEDGSASGRVEGLVSSNTKIETHETAKLQTLDIIRNIVNYALGLVSLVALIYLIYHGIITLTALEDEAQYKKGLKGIQLAAIALGGIGLSRLIVSFIFYVIGGSISGQF